MISIPLLLNYFAVYKLKSTFKYMIIFPLSASMLKWVEEELSFLAVEETRSHKK